MILIPKKNIIRIVLAVAFILLLPLVAMQFTDEVVWDLFDFVFAGALMIGAGLTYEHIARKSSDTAYRAALGLTISAAFLLLWVNGAVGIIGSENNDANSMYLGVFAIGFLGSIIVRFEPRGMARVLFVTALAQALVPVIALLIWRPISWGAAGVFGVFVLNMFFVILFVGSALMFRNAAREQAAESSLTMAGS